MLNGTSEELMKMKKGIGGPLDIIHSIIVMLLAMLLFMYGWGGNTLDPIFVVLLAVVLFILEIFALAG
jgi:hypothetical protein